MNIYDVVKEFFSMLNLYGLRKIAFYLDVLIFIWGSLFLIALRRNIVKF